MCVGLWYSNGSTTTPSSHGCYNVDRNSCFCCSHDAQTVCSKKALLEDLWQWGICAVPSEVLIEWTVTHPYYKTRHPSLMHYNSNERIYLSVSLDMWIACSGLSRLGSWSILLCFKSISIVFWAIRMSLNSWGYSVEPKDTILLLLAYNQSRLWHSCLFSPESFRIVSSTYLVEDCGTDRKSSTFWGQRGSDTLDLWMTF